MAMLLLSYNRIQYGQIAFGGSGGGAELAAAGEGLYVRARVLCG